LYSKNKITTIKALAVPVLVNSFGIFNWLRKEIEKIVRNTRKLLTIEGIYHPKADVNRIHIKRQNGGRGLVNLETTHNTAIVGLSECIKQEEDGLARLVQEYNAGKAECSLQKVANLIKQKYMIQKTAAQDIKKQRIG
jgi:hypothetical protein